MKIVIAGAGEVGRHLAKMLEEENHDIIVMDENIRNLEMIENSTDIYTIVGSPVDMSTLQLSNVANCDLFISVHSNESVNVLAGALAKNLGAAKCIARIDNDDYLKPNNKEIFINMGIDYLFYPEKIAAAEVMTLLGNTSSSEYVNFSGGKLSLVVIKLTESSPIKNKTIRENVEQSSATHRTIAISRNGETIIPEPNFQLKENDMVYIICDNKHMKEVMAMSGATNIKVKNVMIFGGSRIGQKVAAGLQNQVNVKLIEYNTEKAESLASKLNNTLIINRDGRNVDVLHDEGLSEMDAFVAVTGRSETNILAAMLAKKMGVKKVIAEIENFNYIALAESMGVDTIVNKKLITASDIFRFTMNTDVQAIKCLNGCDAEVLEFIAKPNSLITKKIIREVDLPKGSIVGGMVRGEKVLIASSDSQIKAFDRVVIFALPEAISKLAKYFH